MGCCWTYFCLTPASRRVDFSSADTPTTCPDARAQQVWLYLYGVSFVPPLMRELVGAQLRHARVAQGRSLRDLAKSANVSVGHLSELERGKKEPSSELISAVLRELGLSLSALLSSVAVAAARTEVARPHLTLAEPPAEVSEIAA